MRNIFSDNFKEYVRSIETPRADSEGLWCDDDSGIALAHNRLSIIDLTPSGDQPMVSRDGRYVTVFNGEIYNFGDLRALLKDRQVSDLVWKGTRYRSALECISS